MISVIVPAQGTARFAFAASDKIATYSEQQYEAVREIGFPNFPSSEVGLFTGGVAAGTGLNVSSAITAAGYAVVRAGAAPVLYTVGASAQIPNNEITNYQATPGTLNATGALTSALILTGIVTSTTAAAVVATLDTGTVSAAALTSMGIGDAFDWIAINTGGANAFTVTAATDHTIVGAGAVAASSSGRFRTRKTAATTFVTYRIA